MLFLSNSTERAMKQEELSWPAMRPVLMLTIQIIKFSTWKRTGDTNAEISRLSTFLNNQTNLKEEMK